MLSTKVKLYLQANGKVWRDELTAKTISLQNDGDGDYIKSWNVDGLAKPTDSQLDSLSSNTITEENNQSVRTTRRLLYGSTGDQLDEIFKDIDAWKARIQAIKDANPKS
jgi:hypothetical protein